MTEPTWFRRSGTVAAALVALAWIVLLARILRHRIFVSSDTISNYAHVWFVSRVIVHAHRIPYHMRVIGHGRGLAFPYAFVPWVSAALLRPLFGDWVVTLWLVLGTVGLAVTTFWAFPELRRGWWFAIVLSNPFVVLGTVLGQLPFVWAMGFLFAAIACWRRDRLVWGALLAGVAQATHAPVLVPMVALLVLAWLPWERRRRALFAAYAASLLIALPAIWLVFQTPAYTDSSIGVRFANLGDTAGPRLVVLALPIALVLFRRVARPWMLPLVLVACLAGNLAFRAYQSETRQAWRGLRTTPDQTIVPFLESSQFRHHLMYRVLTTNDKRMSMYQVLEYGGRLDSEFFPESIVRKTWTDSRAYCAFLASRRVDRVIVARHYDIRLRKNEQHLLEALSAGDLHGCDALGITVRRLAHYRSFDVYALSRATT